MELSQIRFFLALSDTLNFTRAAELCEVSQPALSRAIRKLEDELGGELIRRERGRTHLTELGKRVRPRLEQALSLAELARSEAHDFSRLAGERLRLGVMCTIGPAKLIALVNHLSSYHPELTLEIVEGSGAVIVEQLLEGEFDVALTGLPSYPDDAVVTPLYGERYIVAFATGHRFENMTTVPLAELDGERYLSRLNCEYPDHIDAVVGSFDSTVDIKYQSEREDWIQAMIVAGLGCACMPEFSPMTPGVQTRILVDPEIKRTISLVTKRGRPHSPAVRLFAQLCRRGLPSRAAG